MVAEVLLFAEAGGMQRTGGANKRHNRCGSCPACAPAPCSSYNKSAVPGSALHFDQVLIHGVIKGLTRLCAGRTRLGAPHLGCAARGPVCRCPAQPLASPIPVYLGSTRQYGCKFVWTPTGTSLSAPHSIVFLHRCVDICTACAGLTAPHPNAGCLLVAPGGHVVAQTFQRAQVWSPPGCHSLCCEMCSYLRPRCSWRVPNMVMRGTVLSACTEPTQTVKLTSQWCTPRCRSLTPHWVWLQAWSGGHRAVSQRSGQPWRRRVGQRAGAPHT